MIKDMIFLFHKLGNEYLDRHWKDMKTDALNLCNQIKTSQDPETHFKTLLSLLKKICSTTRSFCSETDSLILFGKFISHLPSFNDSPDNLEKSFIQSRFKSFIQECFTITSGYGSQKTDEKVF